MFHFIGPVQAIMGIVEPKMSDMAANRHNSNIFHHHQQNNNFILTYSQCWNLAIFMILFMLCAIEVIFVKIVTTISVDDSSIDIDGESYPLPTDLDLMNNNSVHQIDREQQHQQRSIVAHLISTQTFLQRITAMQTTQPFADINNNSNFVMNNNNNIIPSGSANYYWRVFVCFVRCFRVDIILILARALSHNFICRESNRRKKNRSQNRKSPEMKKDEKRQKSQAHWIFPNPLCHDGPRANQTCDSRKKEKKNEMCQKPLECNARRT